MFGTWDSAKVFSDIDMGDDGWVQKLWLVCVLYEFQLFVDFFLFRMKESIFPIISEQKHMKHP